MRDWTRWRRWSSWAVMLIIVAFVLLVSVLIGGAQVPVPNRAEDLAKGRQAYGATMTHDQAGVLLNALAWRYRTDGFGLLRKTGGNRCPQAGGLSTSGLSTVVGVEVSCDWLVHQPSGLGCDALVDGPGTTPAGAKVVGVSTPHWCAAADWKPYDLTKFVAPVDPGAADPFAGGPADPGDSASSDTAQAVQALQAALEKQTALLKALRARVDDLQARVDAYSPPPIPQAPAQYTLVCDDKAVSTNRVWGHAHAVTAQACRIEVKQP